MAEAQSQCILTVPCMNAILIAEPNSHCIPTNKQAPFCSLYAGEHDHDMIHECESAQDQLAVDAILFYTNKIKTQYGPPDKYLPEPKGGASQKPVRSESILQAFAGDAASKEGKRS